MDAYVAERFSQVSEQTKESALYSKTQEFCPQLMRNITKTSDSERPANTMFALTQHKSCQLWPLHLELFPFLYLVVFCTYFLNLHCVDLSSLLYHWELHLYWPVDTGAKKSKYVKVTGNTPSSILKYNIQVMTFGFSSFNVCCGCSWHCD